MQENLIFVDAQELLMAPIDRPQFLVEDLIPGGVNVIAGDEKTGKSWMMLHLALCIAKGEDFLGHPVRQGNVIYLSLEDIAFAGQFMQFIVVVAVGHALRIAAVVVVSGHELAVLEVRVHARFGVDEPCVELSAEVVVVAWFASEEEGFAACDEVVLELEESRIVILLVLGVELAVFSDVRAVGVLRVWPPIDGEALVIVLVAGDANGFVCDGDGLYFDDAVGFREKVFVFLRVGFTCQRHEFAHVPDVGDRLGAKRQRKQEDNKIIKEEQTFHCFYSFNLMTSSPFHLFTFSKDSCTGD